ncbi:MAG: LamG domain-containing protein [Candidatus Hydrogenedentes bacterium]|nr:LamG domain-containing protein [Candidatus Hydrogenedentota bacterium]
MLAYDPRWNDFDAEVLAPIDVRAGVKLEREPDSAFPGDTSPIVLVTTRMENGEWVHLCDFGSAGASGTESVAWLPAAHADPPQNRLITPEDRASAAPGPVLFRWSVAASSERPATVLIARDGAFSDVIQTQHLESGRHWTLAGPLPSGEYYWRVDLGTAEDTHTSDVGRFTIDTAARDPFLTAGPGLELLAANLDGDLNPAHGRLVREQDVLPAPDKKGQPNGARTFNGSSSELVYQVAYIPEDSYSAAAWFRAEAQGREGLQEVLSCWHAVMDDPLRISFEGGAVSARIESGGFFATEAASVNRGEWYHVAAVKDGARLKLYLNGELKSSAAVPATIHTQSDEVGIGCNPYFPGEWFQGNIDEPAFWGRALSEDEIRQLALSKHPR